MCADFLYHSLPGNSRVCLALVADIELAKWQKGTPYSHQDALPKISDYSVVFFPKSADIVLILRRICVDIVVCILSVS